ncbi:DUF5687 family protein [Actinomadura fibrosa]
MAFVALYFSVVFLSLGFALYPILKKMLPEADPIQVVNSGILLWFAAELVIRFMLQTLPVLNIKPLLTAPIPKKKVVNYVLVKSLFSFFNFLPLLIIIPFGLFYWNEEGVSFLPIFGWMVAVYALDLSINYANFLLKKKFADNLIALIPYVIVAVALAVLQYLEIFIVTDAFGSLMDAVIQNPLLALVPVLIALGLYLWNQNILLNRFYLDDSLKGKVQEANTRDFQWVRKFGDIAPFLQLDLKLIWRNKRPKTTIFLSIIIMGYGLIFYPQETYQSMPAIYVFIGIFMTGIFMINFGQFIPAWDASYYSMIMSQNIPLKKYLASKAGLMTFSIIVLAILTTPYVYFGWKILIVNLACAVYNVGVNVPVLLFAGSFNRKRIELEKSPFMNYQGTGATQWIIGLPLMLIPILIFWLCNKFFSFETGVGVLVGLGFVGIVMRNWLMDQIGEAYRNSKYAMIQGFKQTGD